MIPWLHKLAFQGSLHRFLQVWNAVALVLVLAVSTAWQFAADLRQLGSQQDGRLLQALATLPLRPDPAPPPAGTLFKVSSVDNELIAGTALLPAYPWRATLARGGRPDLYVAQLNGRLLRVAAAWRQASPGAPGQARLLQVAEAWSQRLPDGLAWWRSSLAPLHAALVGLAGLGGLGISLAMAWLRRSLHAVQALADADARYTGPSELADTMERARTLHLEQRAWVDDQRRFLANASHQLRTPMAVLRTQLQAAMAGDLTAADALPQMLHTVDRATGLANQLLSLTKLEQLKRQGDLGLVDVREIARSAVLALAPLIAAKRMDFTLDEDTFSVPADPTMLGELLCNLLANAVHHAPERARVGIVLRQGAGQLELIVWDEGPGIDDAVQPRLFHPYAASPGGVGLGLSICQQIAESMGAQVHLHNRIQDGAVIGVDAVVAWGQGP